MAIGGARQRTIMAMLVLAWGKEVSVDSLVEAVWEGQPPSTARTQVAICVAALRKAFRAVECPREVILTAHPGYRLQAAGNTLDSVHFDRLLNEAAQARREGRNEDAAGLYRLALDVWRGPALAGVTGRRVEGAAVALEEQRLMVYEELTGLELGLGRHQELIPQLAAVMRENPLREQLRYNLMLAQYRAGRRAEATETFRDGRQQFVEELGLEPGPVIQRLHDAILRDDPELMLLGSPQETVAAPALSVEDYVVPELEAADDSPRRALGGLPPPVSAFVGRESELASLDLLLDDESRGGGPARGFVTGFPGVGKTGLALYWAHRVTEQFPDGQLYADLFGYDEHRSPAEPGDVLNRFLRSLRVPGERIPTAHDDRVSLYRAILAERRVLVILDNAHSFNQIRDLLPDGGRSCVVVTSREDQQDHLAVGHSRVRLRLDPLPEPDALALLGMIAGADRVTDDPDGARRLVRLCDRTPLALRIAAARLASKPHWNVRHLAARLANECWRLDELTAGDLEVRVSFGLSYRDLPVDVARMYRRLGLLAMPDFTAWVGGALLDMPPTQAENLIEHLVDAQLLEAAGTDATGALRYRFQTLLRLYARERAELEEQEAERREAVTRVLQTWLALAEEAHRREYGGDFSVVHGSAERRPLDRAHTDELLESPLRWFETERESLVASVLQACELSLDELAWDLTASSVVLFEIRNHHENWRLTCERSLEAARRAGNELGEAVMCHELAAVEMFQERFHEAQTWCENAVRLFARIGHRYGHALALRNMVIIDRIHGDHRLAMERLQEAREVFREVGDASALAHTLGQMSVIEREQGALDSSLRLAVEAVGVFDRIGRTRGAAQAVNRLAGAYLALDRFDEAEDNFRRVLQIVRQKHDRRGETHALLGLGEAQLRSGRPYEALATLQTGLGVAQRIDVPLLNARLGLGLGEVLRRLGRFDEAFRRLVSARDAFEALKSPRLVEQAEKHLAELIGAMEDLRGEEGPRGVAEPDLVCPRWR
ncbi:BTAD domain-containing putative transcriptional regulator [Kitasatospora sp. NPDC097691]|uniref:AfsR/SARP family transcriptional regulator n=1 Tax=Kitasatospora sp. NPDC097691 TaxID=3157231 RepID=UPI0033189B08